MTLAQASIITGGVLSLLMALFHTRFYSLFGWTKEFEALTVVSRKIVYTIHLALFLLFFGFAALSLANSAELSQARGVSFTVCLVYALFWLWRTVWQVAYLAPKKGRPAKIFVLFYVLTFVFALLCASYALPLVARLAQG